MPPLVDYASSDSEADEACPDDVGASQSTGRSTVRREDLPPLPSTFHTLYSTNTRSSTVDDPSLHGGRTRQVPHTEGIWPSHIYIEWHPTPSQSSTLTSLLHALSTSLSLSLSSASKKRAAPEEAAALPLLTSLLYTPLSAPAPLHISLSRTLPVPTAARSGLLARVSYGVTHATTSSTATIKPQSSSGTAGAGASGAGEGGVFKVRLGPRLLWVPNEDGSRRFLAVRVHEVVTETETIEEEEHHRRTPPIAAGGRLNRLLWASNEAVAEFGFGALYAKDLHGQGQDQDKVDRSEFFHFSLAWCLASQVDGVEVSQDVLDEVWDSTAAEEARNMIISVDAVMMKIGNAVHRIPLSASQRKATGKSGILG